MLKSTPRTVFKQLSNNRLICAKTRWQMKFPKVKSSSIILNAQYATKFRCLLSKNAKNVRKCFVAHVYTNFKKLKRNLIVQNAKNHKIWEFWTADTWKLSTKNSNFNIFAASLFSKLNIGATNQICRKKLRVWTTMLSLFLRFIMTQPRTIKLRGMHSNR